jgi:hypothetical protein
MFICGRDSAVHDDGLQGRGYTDLYHSRDQFQAPGTDSLESHGVRSIQCDHFPMILFSRNFCDKQETENYLCTSALQL